MSPSSVKQPCGQHCHDSEGDGCPSSGIAFSSSDIHNTVKSNGNALVGGTHYPRQLPAEKILSILNSICIHSRVNRQRSVQGSPETRKTVKIGCRGSWYGDNLVIFNGCRYLSRNKIFSSVGHCCCCIHCSCHQQP